jgi:hypothetical protein
MVGCARIVRALHYRFLPAEAWLESFQSPRGQHLALCRYTRLIYQNALALNGA